MALSAVQVEALAGSDGETDLTGLMRRVQRRDRTAFEELFVHFGPRIKSQMLRSGAEAALAEDIVQDVFLSVWRRADSFVPERGSASAWIYSIARNARIDRLRKQSSRPYEDIAELEIEAPEPGADEEYAAGERAQRLSEALSDLPFEQRQIIELAYMHDMAQSEIASRLSLPLGTVKSRMRLAYAKLKQKLEDLR